MSPRAVPMVDEGRIDLPMKTRPMASSLLNRARRVEGLLARQWSTQDGLDFAKDELLRIAEEALETRRVLCS